ncbi:MULTISPECIES: sensor histidine kinase [unclassified Paenibacillus]|uniref:sensor histidine kinase n=1 Tax=unclassified Paenibacillus TaxID=185978 RepID=UPI003628B848
MDTKSKSKHQPAIIQILIIGLSGLALLLALDIVTKRDYIYGNPYFKQELFYDVQVNMNVLDIAKYYVEYRNYDQLAPQEKISEKTIKQWRDEFDIVINEELTLNERTNSQLSLHNNDFELPFTESTNSAVRTLKDKTGQWIASEWNQQVEGIWSLQLKEITKAYISKRDSEYGNLKRAVARLNNIVKYSIYDHRNNETYTNIKDGSTRRQGQEESQDATHTITFPLKEPIEQLNWLSDYFKQNQVEGTFTFYATVEPEIRGWNTDYVMYKDYIKLLAVRKQLQYEFIGLAASMLAAILLLLYLRKNQSKREAYSLTHTAHWQRIPIDIRMGLLGLVSFLILAYSSTIYDWGKFTPFSSVYRWTLLVILIGYVSISIKDALYLYRTKGAFARQWGSSYILMSGELLQASLLNKKVLFKSVFVFLSTALFGLFAFVALFESAFTSPSSARQILAVVYVAAYLLLILPYLLQRAGTLNRVLAGTNEIAAGHLNLTFEKEHGQGQLSNMARQINNMKLGFKTALEQQLKSERLKSELISNVSHDLKTPLTSMINYVDLLKKESIQQDELQHYVDVLGRKTQRLKVLIDDLFEVSQLTSGTVKPILETVNVASLLHQALAECSDKIDASRLTFRIHIDNPHIVAPLDGKKTWRVFENLINNALNYSMPDTRVHIALTEEAEHIVLRFNNVSAYEIHYDAEELFERSKRGDASRNKEGSGLGLAIAKSIVELQGGQLHIEFDGDYFKVTVRFNKNLSAPMD